MASVGPVAVAVNAMLPSFHLYRGGEASECEKFNAKRGQVMSDGLVL